MTQQTYHCETCGEPYRGPAGLEKAKIYCLKCAMAATVEARNHVQKGAK